MIYQANCSVCSDSTAKLLMVNGFGHAAKKRLLDFELEIRLWRAIFLGCTWQEITGKGVVVWL